MEVRGFSLAAETPAQVIDIQGLKISASPDLDYIFVAPQEALSTMHFCSNVIAPGGTGWNSMLSPIYNAFSGRSGRSWRNSPSPSLPSLG